MTWQLVILTTEKPTDKIQRDEPSANAEFPSGEGVVECDECAHKVSFVSELGASLYVHFRIYLKL